MCRSATGKRPHAGLRLAQPTIRPRASIATAAADFPPSVPRSVIVPFRERNARETRGAASAGGPCRASARGWRRCGSLHLHLAGARADDLVAAVDQSPALPRPVEHSETAHASVLPLERVPVARPGVAPADHLAAVANERPAYASLLPGRRGHRGSSSSCSARRSRAGCCPKDTVPDDAAARVDRDRGGRPGRARSSRTRPPSQPSHGPGRAPRGSCRARDRQTSGDDCRRGRHVLPHTGFLLTPIVAPASAAPISVRT